MEQDHLYNRSLGMSYDSEHAYRDVANGIGGNTGDFDRTNGLENDEGYLPYRLFESNPETLRGAEEYIKSRVENDVNEFGVEQMSDVDFALDRALIAYGIEFTDTPIRLEVAVAEYFGSLASILIDPKTDTISDEDVEILFADIAGRLEAIDTRLLEEQNELVIL